MIGFHFNSENSVRVALDDALAAYISNHFEYRLPVGGVQDYGVASLSMEQRNDNALVNLLRESECFDYIIDIGGLEEPGIGVNVLPLRIPKTRGDFRPGLSLPCTTSTLPEALLQYTSPASAPCERLV